MVDPLEVERLTIGGGIKEITNVQLVGLKFCYNLSEILGPPRPLASVGRATKP